MKKSSILIIIVVASVFMGCQHKSDFTIENKYLSRKISIEGGLLSTKKIINKISKEELLPVGSDEFLIRISNGTDKPNGDISLTSKDFKAISVSEYGDQDNDTLKVELINKNYDIKLDVFYFLNSNEFYARKFLQITSEKEITIERVDVELINAPNAYQPYQLKEITSQGPSKWKPGLGQPLYETKSVTFWGIEFPGATNYVSEKKLNCGYLWGNKLDAKQTYTSYKSVMGVADDYNFIDNAFYKYISDIRIRPLRLQIQYNSWFDFYNKVTKESFRNSVQKIHTELVEKRNIKPLNAYVLDDGWQDSRRDESDWSDKLWKINDKFSPGFKSTYATIDSLDSKLGLWLSPGCFFGAKPMVKKLGEQGFERLELSMSMTGEKYMKMLEERILELTTQGISYFKFDGNFGHLNIRDFELNGRGTPAMPQLKVESLKANDSILNSPLYDELKTYYLVNGTERLINIFDKMAKINPDIFIAITNGAYLSPWWLQYIDVVWMINAGDAASGSSRTSELTYRDGVYYEIWETENTKFPMNALFNHEPKKVNSKEDIDVFRDYLFMNISRGTGFIELYLKTQKLSDKDWDVMAEGLKWSYHIFPTFKNVKMHGGNPRKNEVYGYTAWNSEQGYISIHNPSDVDTTYHLVLNRELGLINKTNNYFISTPINKELGTIQNTYNYNDTISITLKPKGIQILNFDKNMMNWKKE